MSLSNKEGFAEDFIIRLKTRLGQIEKADKEVGVVAVMDGDKILMGKRQDNGKWTNPGGHLEQNENPKEGALRELKEEAGLEHNNAKKMVTKKVTTPEGVKMVIHAYQVKYNGQKPTSKNDPDKEVKKWEWIDTKNMPEKVLNNLHSPRNVILQKMGLVKALMNDLLKSTQSHKYLRKYQRGGKWYYVYHEANQHARAIPEEAIKRLKELADMGDEKARHLLDSVQEYSPVKLQTLRELADLGDAEAKRHLKEHHGIDRDAEKLEEAVIPAQVRNDTTTKVLNDDEKTKLKQALFASMSVLQGLGSHTGSQFHTSLSSIGGHSGIVERIGREVQNASSIKEALTKLHAIASDMDRVQPDPSTSQNSSVREGGGYGSHTYNAFVKELESKGLLPEGYGTIHRRERNQATHSVPFAGDLENKIREKREREERATRERIGRQAENVMAMKNYWRELSNMNAQDQVRLAEGIERFFGKDFNFNNFINNLQGHRDVQIKPSLGFARDLMSGGNSISVTFDFTNNGRQITRATRTIYKKGDGSIHWANGCFSRPDNDDLERFPGMAKGLYAGVEKTLREITANYTGDTKKNTKITIGTAANSGFGNGYKGALVWAKHCFDWEGGITGSRAGSWKSTWRDHAASYCHRIGFDQETLNAIHAKINDCKYPEDFVRLGVKVNKEQAKTMLSRSSFDNDFNKIFETKGYVDLGELIMIDSGTSWSAENRIWGTDERAVELNRRRAIQYGWSNEQRSDSNSIDLRNQTPRSRTATSPANPSTAPPATRPSASTVSAPSGMDLSNEHHRQVQYFMNAWRPSGRNTNIAMTERRLSRIRSWPRQRVEAFLRFARLSPSGKNKVREILRGMNG